MPDLATEKMDTIVGNLLRTGVGLSGTIIFLGGLLYLSRHGSELPAYHMFRGEPADLRTVPGILQDAIALRGRGIIQLGLLIVDRHASGSCRVSDLCLRPPARQTLHGRRRDRPRAPRL